MEFRGVLLEREGRRQIRSAAEPGAARAQIAQVHVHGRDIGVPHVRDERDAAGDELAVGLLGARDLAARLLAEDAPHVADVHTDLLEHGAAHQAGLAAALQAVPSGLLQCAGLEASCGLEGLEGRADARLQVAEISRRGCASAPSGRLRAHVARAPGPACRASARGRSRPGGRPRPGRFRARCRGRG